MSFGITNLLTQSFKTKTSEKTKLTEISGMLRGSLLKHEYTKKITSKLWQFNIHI